MNIQHPPESSRASKLIASGRRAARNILGPLYRPIRRVARFVTWIFPALGKLFLPIPANERRLLAIYDTSSQPFSVGDILIMQAASLALREKHRVDLVDFALVYDPRHPASSDPAFARIREDNAMYHLASILPVAQVNQHLGSLFVFNSHSHLERFIADSADLYHVWPSGWKYASRDYLYYAAFNEAFYEHYKDHGSIPQLSCRPFLREWAQTFYREHVHPHVPITVNVRNNKAFHTHRNLRLECWLDLFRHCETRYPAKFVVVCAWSEIDDRLRECANVIIAKDYHTGIEQDLALINTSAIHLGAGSGPVTMAWFSNKPYLMVNTAYAPDHFSHPDMVVQEEENIQRFWFAGPLQHIAGGVETTELLIREFERMWGTVEVRLWQSPANIDADRGAEVPSWLR